MWGDRYWPVSYWGAYWGHGAPVATGHYWGRRYWPVSYWGAYWGGASVPAVPVERPAYTGDLRLVIGLTALTRGSRPAQGFGGTAVWTLPLRHTYDGDLRLVVALQSVTAIRRAPRPTAYHAPARLGVRVALGSVSRAGDYVAEVVLPDDDEVLTIFAGGRR